MILLSLIGHQSIPNLLPIRYLQPAENLLVYTSETERVAWRLRRIISGSPDLQHDLKTNAYDYAGLHARLAKKLEGKSDVILNLTGGTKMMSFAAFSLAQEISAPFVYMENKKSIILRFQFEQGAPVLQRSETMPELLTLNDYLLAHTDGFTETGFSKNDSGRLNEGGEFEQVVCKSLMGRLGSENVLAGVRPNDAGNQVDIDLAFRIGNQVGIAELKTGGKDSGKRGLDQLKMAAEPTALGTYTQQFLISAGKLKPAVATLAYERKVKVIELPEYEAGRPLPRPAVDRLEREIRQRLAG